MHQKKTDETTTVCAPSLVHVAITLDVNYLRDLIVVVHSILHNSFFFFFFLKNIFFHFLISKANLQTLVESTCETMKQESGLMRHRCTGVLPCELHEVINEIMSILNCFLSNFQCFLIYTSFFSPIFFRFSNDSRVCS